jgi:hypothetical protein
MSQVRLEANTFGATLVRNFFSVESQQNSSLDVVL